jgi:DNA repair protein RecN (Recombination protein N)
LLADLGIPNVEFYVALNREILEVPSNSELYVTIENQNYKAYANGCDKAEFFISTNKGEVPKPLSFVASGGEISRVMLAIKTIVAEADNLPILIFDEIDSGISGRIAQKVGIAMKQLAAKHQIIAITHLPQIAAKGDRNFNVKKIELENKTIISCECLNDVDKVKEIAKLISGEVVTEKALESAKELLK